METELIPLERGQWLSDALKAKGYDNIPTNSILKKTLPGLGATHGEIHAPRHSIIIEPNVPVILGKTKDKPHLLGIHENVRDSRIEKYLNNEKIRYKKFITTPESYHRIREVILKKRLTFDIYEECFCLFDECEKIIQDIDYRENIAQPINDFFKFRNKAFVSATTLDMTHPEFENQNFKILEIDPQYNYKKDIEVIVTNRLEVQLIEKLNSLIDSECVCVFLNKTDSIDKIINSLRLKDKSKVFCSRKSVAKLKKKEYKNVSEQIELPLAKYNFFTSRFFSAVDINIKQKSDIIILTILSDANHTVIDPFTESIQIYGRFRKNKHHGEDLPFKSLTHIADFNIHFNVKTKDEITKMINTYKTTYDNILQSLMESDDKIEKEALRNDIDKLVYTSFLDDERNYNYFSQDNFYHSERVKGYYSNSSLLKKAYEDTNHFNIINYIQDDGIFNFPTNWLKNSKITKADKRRRIIHILEEQSKDTIERCKETYRPLMLSDTEGMEMWIDAYSYLGFEKIEKIGYGSPKKILDAINRAKAIQKEENSLHRIIKELKTTYQVGDTPTKNELKDFIQDIYHLNGIDIKITQDTIRKYCEVKEHNSQKPAKFKIIAFNL